MVAPTQRSTAIDESLLRMKTWMPLATPIAQFFEDAAAGTLPNVVFLDPGFLGDTRSDEHPHGLWELFLTRIPARYDLIGVEAQLAMTLRPLIAP